MTLEEAKEFVLEASRKGLVFRICPICGEQYGYEETECPHCKGEEDAD